MLKRFRKGAGEFIGYSISILFLTIFYIIILNSLILNNAENVMEECILSVGRQVVICDSLEQAQERVQDAAEYYLERETRVIDHSSIRQRSIMHQAMKVKIMSGKKENLFK